ncbi:L-fucose:H+ symporter permease [Dactylosporangium sp. NBC_01737]|uniref:L-fucose:H+ symporter permease n=1 Tax=Dactylosporangium sp. NBC_01737 TaxID=2975959 RepID=UPI002E0EF323|nr:L-fucose:H+ symporter permease [Dactylosporangium sp. NBC_01737]
MAPPSADEDERGQRPHLLGRGMLLLFIALIGCFTAWGIAQDLTTPMVAGFKRIFAMSTFQASLVQLAYFGAYFLLALPAAFINQRFGYKTGILTGLGLAALGAFLFYPASKIMTYEAFLLALFAMAAGCSVLETSANPYVMSLGPEETATRRLNFAQAFNPVGTNIGVLLASTLILPKLAEPVDISSLSQDQLHAIRASELGAVMVPYLGLAVLLVLIAVAIASQKAPPIVEEFPGDGQHTGGTGHLFGVLWRSKQYRFGVIAQFANIAAQVCTWTFLIQYVQQALGGSLQKGGAYLQVSLLLFLGSRFLMTWVIGRVRATKVLAVLAFLAVVLCLFAISVPNLAGVLAVVALSFCLSLMFPTIYGVALKGLGPATKFGAAGLVMAIVGGAIMPLLQGKLLDQTSAAISFVVPAVCFAVVGLYALYDLRAAPGSVRGSTEPGRPGDAGPSTVTGGAA